MDYCKLEAGGVTQAAGFTAAGVHCGIKKNKKDLAVVYSQYPAVSAGVFTKNRFCAAPVIVTSQHLLDHKCRTIVCNSGNANACTGEQGLADAKRMAALTAEELDLSPDEVIVASTGVIGVSLPMVEIEKGICMAVASLSLSGGNDAAEAIMTTDLVGKEVAYKLEIGGKTVTVGGMAKGSGMISPNMATMLAFITTDAAISPSLLQQALRYTVDRSYNLVTVDGDTSTNDMAVIMANGAAGNTPICTEDDDYRRFLAVLQQVNIDLAQMIVRDGEGATKFIELTVKNAHSFQDGRKLAMGILNSSLVKTAFFGEDANWGRIISAMGQTDAEFTPELVDVFLGDLQVASKGQGLPFDESRAKDILKSRDINVTVDLKMGDTNVTAWGTDLSYDYVSINASYRS